MLINAMSGGIDDFFKADNRNPWPLLKTNNRPIVTWKRNPFSDTFLSKAYLLSFSQRTEKVNI